MWARRISLSSMLLLYVQAIAPPSPELRQEYAARRRRLSEDFSQHNNDRFCHDLSEHECQQFKDQLHHRGLQTKKLVKASGILKTLVLLVKFPDHKDRVLPSREDIEQLWNAPAGIPSPLIPTGSIREFLRRNSYDHLLLDAHVTNWTETDNTELYYSFGDSGLNRQLVKSMYPILSSLDDEGFDFSQFDRDGDGVIDSLVMLHSGFPAEFGGVDCYTNREKEERIWSHAIGKFENEWFSKDGQFSLGSYMVGSALRENCGSSIARIGVMTHEFIHTWGIPDLYDTSGDWIGKGVGTYDIMSNPYGLTGAQTHPNNMSPWSKMQSGWLEPIEIKADGLYSIEASAFSPSVYMIKTKYPRFEYLLIENRQPVDWDAFLWRGGLLIWHIDDQVANNNRRGFPGQDRWPGNGNHYRVAIASADRKYDLERGENEGDETDFWVQGQELKPGVFEYEATDFTQYPNTNSYKQGLIWPTGIRIYDISESGTVMTFRVSGLSPRTPSPTAQPEETSSPSMAPSIITATQEPIQKMNYSSSTEPSYTGSYFPSASPTFSPSNFPSSAPIEGSESPSPLPSWQPSNNLTPNNEPNVTPVTTPKTQEPTAAPSSVPLSLEPTVQPLSLPPTIQPMSLSPTTEPTEAVTTSPSPAPSIDIDSFNQPTLGPGTLTESSSQHCHGTIRTALLLGLFIPFIIPFI